MDFPAGYLPSYRCICCCFLPRAAALTPCASPGIPSDACYKCKCPNVPLKDPSTEAWVGLRTLDFHQVIIQVTRLPEASDQTWRSSVRGLFLLTQWLDQMPLKAPPRACGSPGFHAPWPWALGGNVGRGNVSTGGGGLELIWRSLSRAWLFMFPLLPPGGFPAHVLALSNCDAFRYLPLIVQLSYGSLTFVLWGAQM